MENDIAVMYFELICLNISKIILRDVRYQLALYHHINFERNVAILFIRFRLNL